MLPRLMQIGVLALLLTACEEQSVQRNRFVDPVDLLDVQETGGIWVEVHGLPWASATPEEVVGTLRMPPGALADMRFRYIPPGQVMIGSGDRLVLHFNPIGPHDAMTNCKAKTELETGPGKRSRFTVSATYCAGTTWQVHTVFEADASEADWLAYFQRMQELFAKMFPIQTQ